MRSLPRDHNQRGPSRRHEGLPTTSHEEHRPTGKENRGNIQKGTSKNMSPREFLEKVSYCLIVCDGMPDSSFANLLRHPDVEKAGDPTARKKLHVTCQLKTKNGKVPPAQQNFMTYPEKLDAEYTYGEIFIELCDRDGLLATDEGDHYQVQAKEP